MPDETTTQPTDVAETPQGAEETDWKAESRKHERREKENASKVRELQERLAKYEAADEDRRKQAEDADRKRSDELEKLKAENQQLKETAERERMVERTGRTSVPQIEASRIHRCCGPKEQMARHQRPRRVEGTCHERRNPRHRRQKGAPKGNPRKHRSV